MKVCVYIYISFCCMYVFLFLRIDHRNEFLFLNSGPKKLYHLKKEKDLYIKEIAIIL